MKVLVYAICIVPDRLWRRGIDPGSKTARAPATRPHPPLLPLQRAACRCRHSGARALECEPNVPLSRRSRRHIRARDLEDTDAVHRQRVSGARCARSGAPHMRARTRDKTRKCQHTNAASPARPLPPPRSSSSSAAAWSPASTAATSSSSTSAARPRARARWSCSTLTGATSPSCTASSRCTSARTAATSTSSQRCVCVLRVGVSVGVLVKEERLVGAFIGNCSAVTALFSARVAPCCRLPHA